MEVEPSVILRVGGTFSLYKRKVGQRNMAEMMGYWLMRSRNKVLDSAGVTLSVVRVSVLSQSSAVDQKIC